MLSSSRLIAWGYAGEPALLTRMAVTAIFIFLGASASAGSRTPDGVLYTPFFSGGGHNSSSLMSPTQGSVEFASLSSPDTLLVRGGPAANASADRWPAEPHQTNTKRGKFLTSGQEEHQVAEVLHCYCSQPDSLWRRFARGVESVFNLLEVPLPLFVCTLWLVALALKMGKKCSMSLQVAVTSCTKRARGGASLGWSLFLIVVAVPSATAVTWQPSRTPDLCSVALQPSGVGCSSHARCGPRMPATSMAAKVGRR